MSNCVVRFVGNSLSKFPVLEAFASLLSESGNNKTVVISAVPEIQQILEQGIELLISNSVTSDQIISQIQNLVTERLNVFHQPEFDENLNNELKNLQNLLKGIEFTGDFSVSLKDQVISYSERITAGILHLFLRKNQISSNLIYPEDIGLHVTKEFGNATFLYEESTDLPTLLPKGINLIPGSYGITSGGKIARLGKRSADYSAAAITRLTEAECLQLWELDKEFRTSDSEFVAESKLIPRLTYSEASELSYFSELSIHPRIVEPLINNHIPIHVYRLKNKGKELTTIINSETFVSQNVVKSFVHTE